MDSASIEVILLDLFLFEMVGKELNYSVKCRELEKC